MGGAAQREAFDFGIAGDYRRHVDSRAGVHGHAAVFDSGRGAGADFYFCAGLSEELGGGGAGAAVFAMDRAAIVRDVPDSFVHYLGAERAARLEPDVGGSGGGTAGVGICLGDGQVRGRATGEIEEEFGKGLAESRAGDGGSTRGGRGTLNERRDGKTTQRRREARGTQRRAEKE